MTESDHLAGYVPPGGVRRRFRNLVPERTRQAMWRRLMRTPGVKQAWLALDPSHRARRVTRRTKLVMDGYPRSGNTYARAAFDHANGKALKVSSHMHDPDSVLRAIKYGLPTLVLVREPRATMASMIQFNPVYEPDWVLRTWTYYYEIVERNLDRIVLADFREVVGDFGAVTDRINAKFGTDFKPYRRSEQAEDEISETIEEVARINIPDQFEDRVSLPSAARRSAEDIATEMGAEERELLAEADALHQRLLERARA